MTTRRILIILAVIVNLAILLASRSHWNSELDEHFERSKQVLSSDEVDLGVVGTTSWEIPSGSLPVPDFARLSLVVNRTPEMTGSDYHDKTFELQVEVEAEGHSENGVLADRFIRSYFSPTNQPLQERPRLWAGWPDEHAEYWLGQVAVMPKEDLRIRFHVLRPDPALAPARVTLQLVPEHDSAVPGHIFLFWLLRDVGLLSAVLAALFLGFAAHGRSQRH